jgi:hypothetical protein
MSQREVVEFVLQAKTSQAKAEVENLTKSVDTLKKSTATAAADTKKLDDSLKGIKGGAENARGAMEGVAAALGLVSPEAAGAVRQVSMLTAGIQGLARTGPLLVGYLGAAALAVGVLSLAWRKLSDDLDKANEKQEKAAKLALESQNAYTKSGMSVAMMRLKADVDAGRAAPADLAAAQIREQAANAFAEPRAVEEGRAQAERARIAELEALLRSPEMQGNSQGVQIPAALQAQADIAAAKTRLGNTTRAIAGLDRQAEELGRAMWDGFTAGAKGKPASMPKGTTSAGGQVSLDGFGDGIEADLAGWGRPAAFDIPTGVGRSYTFSGYDGALPGQLLPAIDRKPNDERGRAFGMGALGLVQGDVGGMLGALGPAGMALGGLANVGRMGASGVRDQLEGFTDSVIAGLEALPEILTEVIPDFVGALVSDLLPALVESFPELAKAIALDLPIAIARALVEALAEILPGGNAKTNFGGKFANTAMDIQSMGASALFDVGFGRGGSVSDRTGHHLTGSGGGTVNSRGEPSRNRSTGGQTVIVQGSVFGSLDTFSRDLDSHLGYGGPGRSSALGR